MKNKITSFVILILALVYVFAGDLGLIKKLSNRNY